MNIKKSLNEWAKKHDPSAMERRSRFGHSIAYHGFFEGYTEIRVPNPSGHGTRIERIYTGAYYKPELSVKAKVLLRILYSVLYALSVVLFGKAALLDVPSNRTWYVTVFQACALPMLMWMLIGLLYYFPVKEKLEIPEYKRSSRAVRRSSLAAAVCAGAAAVFVLVFTVINGGASLGGELLSALFFALSGGMLFAVNRMEARIEYKWLDSTVEKPSDGVEIE